MIKLNEQEAKSLIEKVFIDVTRNPLNWNESLKDQGLDSLDQIEFILELEKSADIHEISAIDTEALLERPIEMIEYLVKATDYKQL